MLREKKDVVVRDATLADARFVAWTVLLAIDLDPTEKNIKRAVKVCSADDTLYSWRNARICEVDGKVAGCLVSYSGDLYPQMRLNTYQMIKENFGLNLLDNPFETQAGEFYLDSMAFLPEFRGYGLGKTMLLDGVEKGKRMGFHKTTLLVADLHKPHLEKYYESIGFKPDGRVFSYGEDFMRMSCLSV